MEWLASILEIPFLWLSAFFFNNGPLLLPPSDKPGLALDLETGLQVSLPAQELAKHCYLLGSTGCGKTTAILKLVEADIKAGHSLVVVDLRGDLIARVLGLCAFLGVPHNVVTLLDLREKDRVRGFDPLSGAGEPYIRALHVLSVVAAEAESWGVQLEETLRSALLLLAVSDQPLTRLEDVFFDRHFRLTCAARISDPGLRGFWDRFEELSTEKQHAWALPVLNKVSSLLAVPTLRAVLSGENGFDLGSVLSTNGSVCLVSLAVDELHRSSRMLGSLIVSAISREMMARVDIPEELRNPVRLYVDEFENFASESFESLIAEGRRFGLTLVLSHQTLLQLQPKLRSVIRNNVWLQCFFQLGFEDATHVARELPEEIGPSELRTLNVGEAYLMRRDGSAQRVRFHRPGLTASRSAMLAFRALVLPAATTRSPGETSSPELVVDLPEGGGPNLEDWL